ncbi:MAG: hypothetical protein KA022_00650 [Candidatus Omnitrophica bacterium]|jgi:Flp pilus assembly pilin Flp|nr:hypothetical protein [Candidatus Omnitrophota bacterium]
MQNKKAFLSLEYALLIAILVAALVAMGFYVRRALSAKWRDAGDAFGFGRQYQP